MKTVSKKTTPQHLSDAAARKEVQQLLGNPEFSKVLAKLAPKYLSPDRLLSVALSALTANPAVVAGLKNPYTRATLFDALRRCAITGLEPDGRVAHLVPYWDNKRGAYRIQVIFDYKGLILLAKRNGIHAKGILVCEKDKFELIEDDGTGRTVVHHSYNPLTNRGPIVGAYCRTIEPGAPPDYEFMSIDEIGAIRDRSRAKTENTPWQTDFAEMAKKCPVRRASKRWDIDPRARAAIVEEEDMPEAEYSTPVFDVSESAESEEAPVAIPEKTDSDQEELICDPVSGLLEKIKEANLTEEKVLNFLFASGQIAPEVSSLRQVDVKLIHRLLQNWTIIKTQIEHTNE